WWEELSVFAGTPRPAARGSLFARSGHPVLTRAQNIHVLLVAIPGRQGAAHCDCCHDAPVGAFLETTSVTARWSSRGGGCGKQRMDALRRRVSHGWLTEPGSNPRRGTTPDRSPDPVACPSADPSNGEELFGLSLTQ